MKNLVSLILFCFVIAIASTTVHAAAISVIDHDPTYAVPAENSLSGWQFQVNSDLLVTRLGIWDEAGTIYGAFGLNESYEIGLFRVSDGALLTSGIIDSGYGNDFVDGFVYIDTPDVQLSTLETYDIVYFASNRVNGGDNMLLFTSLTEFEVSPEINYLQAGYAEDPSGLQPLTRLVNTSQVRFGPNFEFTVVPIPAAVWLFGSGLFVLGWLKRKGIRN